MRDGTLRVRRANADYRRDVHERVAVHKRKWQQAKAILEARAREDEGLRDAHLNAGRRVNVPALSNDPVTGSRIRQRPRRIPRRRHHTHTQQPSLRDLILEEHVVNAVRPFTS